MIAVVRPPQLPRLRVRAVDAYAVAARAIANARATARPVVLAVHGGTVANAYGYRAETETVLAVAFPSGDCAVWCGRTRANSATLAAVARSTVPEVAALFDGRTGEPRRKEAEQRAWSAALAALREAREAARVRA